MQYFIDNLKIADYENAEYLVREESKRVLLPKLVFLSKKVTEFRNKFLNEKHARLSVAYFAGVYQVSYFDLKTDTLSGIKKLINKIYPVFKESELKEYRAMASLGTTELGKSAVVSIPESMSEEFITNLCFLNIIDQEEFTDYDTEELENIRKFRLNYLLYSLVSRGRFNEDLDYYTLGDVLGIEYPYDSDKFSGRNNLVVFISDIKDNIVKMSLSFTPKYWRKSGFNSGLNQVRFDRVSFKILLSNNGKDALLLNQLNSNFKAFTSDYLPLNLDIRNFKSKEKGNYIECIKKDNLYFIRVNEHSATKLYTLECGKFKAEEINVNNFTQTKVTLLDVSPPSEFILNCKISELPFMK